MKKIIIERFLQKDFDDQFIKFMLNLNLSFQSYENEFFLELIRFMRNDVYIFNRTRFSNIINEQANLVKQHVLNNLDQDTKISIALIT